MANSRCFFELLELEIARSKRYKHPFSLAYLDLDNFKTVNDRFGHTTGDKALRTITDYVKKNLRTSVLAVSADTVQCELSKYQVERCPDWDQSVPVYRQHEENGGSAFLTVPSLPNAPFNVLAYDLIVPGEGGQEDLVQGKSRSMVHFFTCTIAEESEQSGEISDFAINPACWIIDHLIATDRSGPMQRISLLPVSCVEHIDFKNSIVYATGTACRSN